MGDYDLAAKAVLRELPADLLRRGLGLGPLRRVAPVDKELAPTPRTTDGLLEALGHGLLLTTLASDPPGDQGVCLVTPWLPMRLPVNETIRVWPAGDPDAAVPAPAGATVVARHDVWVLGLPALRLNYVTTPAGRGP